MKERKTSLLALVPVIVALVLGGLMIPRRATPGEVPLPAIDRRALARQIAMDHALAERARSERLDANVLALGTAIRAFNGIEARGEETAPITEARMDLDRLVPAALDAGGIDGLLRLRAVQLEEFLVEVKRYEATGARSNELDEVSGTFVQSMVHARWARDASGAPAPWPPPSPSPKPVTIVLDDAARRAAFKSTWAHLLGLSGSKELALTLDEQRALYAFYFQHAHAPENQRVALEASRARARDPAVCAQIDEGERVAAFGWLLSKMKELAAIDPAYPFAYARGIALYHRHEYAQAAESFQDWLDKHPNGPWTLRAKNYLQASLAETAL
jgi:hypothetical protein